MKKHAFPLLLLACLVFSSVGCAPPETVRRSESPDRLVSTVPSITEVLFDIGIGDRIVADSKFTIYPPEAKEIEKIGDLYDINWEKIVGLKADLVLFLDGNKDYRVQCRKLGIESLEVDHGSMEGVLASYDLIGERLGPEVLPAAQARKAALEAKLEILREKAVSLPPVRVLICIDRARGIGRLQNLYVAGTNPYFQDVIRWAGGTNVAESTGLAFPNVSIEGVLAMNPDVIVDLMAGEGTAASAGISEEEKVGSIDDWKTLGEAVGAVKSGRIYVVTENFATIPGPRTPLFVEKFMEILHGTPAGPE